MLHAAVGCIGVVRVQRRRPEPQLAEKGESGVSREAGRKGCCVEMKSWLGGQGAVQGGGNPAGQCGKGLASSGCSSRLGSGGRATVNLSAPPLTGPPRVPGEPPLSSPVFSVFPRICFERSLISSNQPPCLSEKTAITKTSLPPAILMLTAPARIDVSSSGFSSELHTLLSPWMSHRHKIR